MNNIVILGAGYAGMLAALRLSGKLGRRQTHITLINASETFVERIRLHQTASGETLRTFSVPKLLRGKPVDFVQGWISALDPDAQTVTVEAAGQTRQIAYDTLLYTLGSSAQKTAIPGLAEHTLSMGRPEQAAALRDKLRQSPAGAHIAIIGGGLTGIESASEIAEQYPALKVSLWTDEQLGAGLSQKGRTYLRQQFARMGIELHENARVAAISDHSLTLESGENVPYDKAIWAGSFAVSPLAREAGLKVNARGQILVDATLRSISHSNIFAAGDSAAPVENPGAPMRMGCVTAMPMGAQAADNLAAVARHEAPQPFHFAYAVQCISLGRHDALVQIVGADDSPRERIVTGRGGALVKEGICQFTTWSLRAEALFPGLYRWPGQSGSAAPQPEVQPQV